MGTAQSKSNKHYLRPALIFSHKKFLSLELREGNESDVEGLRDVLSLFGFYVKVFPDETRDSVLEIIKHYATKEDHSEHDCLLVIVLTHGDRGGVLWANDCEYYTKDVWGPFLNCNTLQNKPKIFVFQACRGRSEESRFQINSASQLESKVSREMCVPVLPHSPGFLLIHSTVEENLSKRDPKTGTIYIRSLCNRLHEAKVQNVDILTLLTNVNSDVMGFVDKNSVGQTSTFTSFLHHSIPVKSVAVVPAIQNQPSTSQSSHFKNDARQGVVQTCYPRNGRLIIFILYTSAFESNAKEMTSVLMKLPDCMIALNTNIDEIPDLKTLLITVSMSNQTIFTGAHSLLVMVIAEICETNVTDYCEKLFIKTMHSMLPINSVWGHFTASQCPWLRGKPKLFFFCDLHRTDDTRDIVVQQTLNVESFNNNADFFWSFCYGEDPIFRELLFAFGRFDEEITQMMTTVMRRAETTMVGKTGRFSHFQSTLRLQFYFSPPQGPGSVEETKDSQLLLASEKGDTHNVKRLLTLPNIDVNVTDDHGSTPLILACKNRHFEIVELLIATSKAKVTALDHDLNGALYWAARRGHLPICVLLLEHGAPVNVRNKYGNTPIYWPAREGNIEMVKLLVQNKADIRVKNRAGRPPLHWAANNGRFEVVKYLVDQGSDINSYNLYGSTPLHQASEEGREDRVNFFLELGACLELRDGHFGMTPLSWAVRRGKLNMVKYLITRGADVNTKDDDGDTPLHFSCNVPDVARLLVDNGANITENKKGQLPILPDNFFKKKGIWNFVKRKISKFFNVK